ncbi:MAG: low molecular weight protein arginine phosphatase [Calothrix sp. SM1_7_51]|nr:low molecular weight protein arginine phosphatase [Calothrix sp. SM1_7_51]
MRILFVCNGNILSQPNSRSLIREKIGQSLIEVRSAGMYAFNGEPLSPKAMTVLRENSIYFSHNSQRLNQEMLEWADLIFTMTKRQKYMIMLKFIEVKNKIFTLKEFVGQQDINDISNPFGKDLKNYRQFFGEIDQILNILCEKLAFFSSFKKNLIGGVCSLARIK